MKIFTKLGWLPDSQPFNFLRQARPVVPQIQFVESDTLPLPQVDFGSGTGGGRRKLRKYAF